MKVNISNHYEQAFLLRRATIFALVVQKAIYLIREMGHLSVIDMSGLVYRSCKLTCTLSVIEQNIRDVLLLNFLAEIAEGRYFDGILRVVATVLIEVRVTLKWLVQIFS